MRKKMAENAGVEDEQRNGMLTSARRDAWAYGVQQATMAHVEKGR